MTADAKLEGRCSLDSGGDPEEVRDPSTLEPWEEAYRRFETPKQEERKFVRRLKQIGALRWPRDARIVELFCGRCNGLNALSALGFCKLEGVDMSPRLLALYRGPARTYVGDCRSLPFERESRDILIVQGGLHHLQTLPSDLEKCLSEVHRVLRADGLFVAIEPWQTFFLGMVHRICRIRFARRCSRKIDSLAKMIELEQGTYDRWLLSGPEVVRIFSKYFVERRVRVGWGKRVFVGVPRQSA